MAIINKTGITTGGTIQAEHVTRAIDALSGGSTDTIVATGSFSGSLTGVATSASFATTASFALNGGTGAGFPFTGSARITGSLSVTGSFSQRSTTSAIGIDSNNDGTMSIKGLAVSVSASSLSFIGDGGIDLSGVISKGAGLVLPLIEPNTSPFPKTGSMYFDTGSETLWIYTGTTWRGWEPSI